MSDLLQRQRDAEQWLKEYNVWLTDPNREIGVPYPKMGELFGNVNSKEKSVNLGEAILKATVKTPVKQPKAVKTPRAPRVGTKQEKVNEIVKLRFERVGVVDKTFKADLIHEIMDEVGMSKAGATTYLYNALKTL